MHASIASYIFNKQTGDMEMRIKCDTTSNSMTLLWQKRQSSRNLNLYGGVYFQSAINNGIAEFKMNVNEILDISTLNDKEIIWDCFYVNGNEKVGISFPEVNSSFEYHFFEKSHLYKIIPFVTRGAKTLALFMKTAEIQSSISFLEIQNNRINGILEIESNEIDIQHLQAYLCLRKRNHNSLTEYTQEVSTKLIYKENKYQIKGEFKEFFNNLSNHTLWDIFVKLENSNNSVYVSTICEQSSHIKVDFNDFFYSINVLSTLSHNRVTLRISQKEMVSLVDSVLESQDHFYIKGKLPKLGSGMTYSLVSKLRGEVADSFEYFNENEKAISTTDNLTFDIKVSIAELISNFKDRDIWDLFIRYRQDNELFYDIPLSSNNNQKLSSSNKRVTLFVNGSQSYSIWVNVDRAPGDNLTNVAVLGTCYSRNAFNTSDYFNPYYKKLYKCSYTQFHSNIMSLVSDPVEFNESEFLDCGLKPSDIKYIRSDFEKDFFENLIESKAEYLIIDFYVDACREVIQIKENANITLNYLLPRTKYFKQIKSKHVISHTNNEEYFDLWKENIKLFVERLLGIMPANKIILNRGRLTTKYLDSNNKINYFPDQDIIKRNNILWDRMEHYLLNLIPKIKIIDMRDTSFVGHYNHPFGKSYAHYESGYYKEFLSKLNEIVLMDKK
ncbi:DUF6270 domain-containing protein [Bacillus sp. FSL R5-0422]|uniref:DUF6270 domain-containing protein n=1 Tax=Bacillus sp. FSL R5-0422 TaxID=2921577 RepID=UPI003159A322